MIIIFQNFILLFIFYLIFYIFVYKITIFTKYCILL